MPLAAGTALLTDVTIDFRIFVAEIALSPPVPNVHIALIALLNPEWSSGWGGIEALDEYVTKIEFSLDASYPGSLLAIVI